MSIFKVPQRELDRLEEAIRNHPRLNDAGEVDRLFIEFQPLFSLDMMQFLFLLKILLSSMNAR